MVPLQKWTRSCPPKVLSLGKSFHSRVVENTSGLSRGISTVRVKERLPDLTASNTRVTLGPSQRHTYVVRSFPLDIAIITRIFLAYRREEERT